MTPDASLAAADNAVLEALPAALYVTDAAGRLTFYNAAAVGVWGFAPELGTLLQDGSWRLLNIDRTPVPPEQDPLGLTLRTGSPVRDVEMIAIRADGTEIRFLSYPNVIMAADGAVVGGMAYLAIQMIEANLVTPTIVGRRLELSPVAILVFLALSTWMWGVIGAIIGVPVLVVIKVFCDNFPALSSLGEFLSAEVETPEAEPAPAALEAQPTTEIIPLTPESI
jgi:PAS domain-containing protein